MKPIRDEEELQRFFKRDYAKKMGYKRVIKEDVGKVKPFPDFWCIDSNNIADSIEIEVYSYNFIIHGHRASDVEIVLYAVNTHPLYGLKLPRKFTLFQDVVVSQDYDGPGRTPFQIIEALERGDNYSLARYLPWFQPLEDAGTCVVCQGPLPLTQKGNLSVSKARDEHADCLSGIELKMERYLEAVTGSIEVIAEEECEGDSVGRT